MEESFCTPPAYVGKLHQKYFPSLCMRMCRLKWMSTAPYSSPKEFLFKKHLSEHTGRSKKA